MKYASTKKGEKQNLLKSHNYPSARIKRQAKTVEANTTMKFNQT